jgi:TetR/AcrR family transcriptional regulator, mexJK operon transcriptional repressor
MTVDMDKAPTGKREQRRAERREAILEIAQQSFLDNGYDRTTMSAIAETMGGSKGTLWSYFDSKEALFEAMIDRAGAQFRSELTEALGPHGSPETGLLRFAETFIRKITRHDAIALQRMIVGEGPRFPKLGPIFYARAPGVTRELLSGYIGGRMEAGALRKDDPTKAAHMLLCLCSGGHHQRVLWGIETYSEKTACTEAKTAVEHFLRAYAPGTESSASGAGRVSAG